MFALYMENINISIIVSNINMRKQIISKYLKKKNYLSYNISPIWARICANKTSHSRIRNLGSKKYIIILYISLFIFLA